ncbi:unnamed protein product [Polarella glacialis]|uniref:Uncharacterized protein n=1 Tax=Polarella glacialis TaxID=89957 RepID=A0A813K0Y9_POLGL|nr:unnamed protein product [Polarella glacialis]
MAGRCRPSVFHLWRDLRKPKGQSGMRERFASLPWPVLGDVVAGFVKGIVELAAAVTFATLMTPRSSHLRPYLPLFLRYAVFGYVVSQLLGLALSRYRIPLRTCNVSATVFLVQVLHWPFKGGSGTERDDVAVNTLLMAATVLTWLGGVLTWLMGSFKLTSSLRFLSAPVKLGLQGSVGYFLFAMAFGISSGVNWINFKSWSQASVFLQPDVFAKCGITLASGISMVYCLNRYSWPYVVPTFILAGTAAFHVVFFATGMSMEEAGQKHWLYHLSSSSEEPVFEFLFRIYDFQHIDWMCLQRNILPLITGAILTPVLSATINLVLFQTTFTEEEVGMCRRSPKIWSQNKLGSIHIRGFPWGISRHPWFYETAVLHATVCCWLNQLARGDIDAAECPLGWLQDIERQGFRRGVPHHACFYDRGFEVRRPDRCGFLFVAVGSGVGQG